MIRNRRSAMGTSPDERTIRLLAAGMLLALVGVEGWPQKLQPADAPGALSASHAADVGLPNCLKCHTPDLVVEDAKCLGCHLEIASRVIAGRGYHRDKGSDCRVCHGEHRGPEVSLIDFDVGSFDHAETGRVQEGAHARVKECGRCHRPDNAPPHKTGTSFLLKDPTCIACHESPHPGRQAACQACHGQVDWRVGR